MKIQPPLFVAACCALSLGIAPLLRSAGSELPILQNGVHLLSLTSSAPRSGVLVARNPQAEINIRIAPSTQATVVTVAYSSDPVTVLAESQRPDGYSWYQVRLNSSGTEGWVRGDLVRVQAANEFSPIAANSASEPEAVGNPGNPYGFPEYNDSPRSAAPPSQPPPSQPGAIVNPAPPARVAAPTRPDNQPGAIATVPRSTPGRELVFGTNQPIAIPTTRQPAIAPGIGGEAPTPRGFGGALQRAGATVEGVVGAVTDRVDRFLNPGRPQPTQFTQAQVDYFMEIALGSELGNSNQLIRKWTQNVRIKVTGNPTSEDSAALDAVIGEINGLISSSGVQLTLDNNNPNVEIIYASQAEFRRLEPNYASGSSGFFRTFWDRGVINRARILITNSSRVSQRERSHVVREELTQVMGLVRDSWRYQDSIFYQGWTDVNQYSADDRALIQLLYSTNIQPGMSRSQVASALQTVLAQQAASN